MSYLQLFVLPSELQEILRNLASKHKLTGCIQRQSGIEPYDPLGASSVQEEQYDGVYNIFLFPIDTPVTYPISFSTETPKREGWIQVTPGALVETEQGAILLLTSLATMTAKGLSFDPSAWLRRLKKELQPIYKFGVDRIYTVTGETDWYGDIGFSPEAMSLHDKSVLWKQYETGNAEFVPKPTDSSLRRRTSHLL